jgi:hypothetical protein
MSSTLTSQTAETAYSFDETIGVNVQASYTDTAYGDVSAWEAAVLAGGFETVRMPLPYGDAALTTVEEQFMADGIRIMTVYNPSQMSVSQFVDYLLANPTIAQGLWAVEGPNEPDISGNANWASQTASVMQQLYTAIKSNPELSHIQIIAPALANYADPTVYSELGNLSQYVDYGNAHGYPGNTYLTSAQIGDVVSFASDTEAPGKPFGQSETGYSTLSASGAASPDAPYPQVSQQAAAVYILREYFSDFAAGMSFTDIYELVDEQNDGTFTDNFGLLNSNYTPKPAYTAIEAMTTLLKDPQGADFKPGALTYSLSGSDANTQSVLLEKSDGTFWLAIWENVSVYNASTGQTLNPAPVPVTLTLGSAASGAIYIPNESGTTAVSTFNGTTTISFDSSADVTLVEIDAPGSNSGSTSGSLMPSPNGTTVFGAIGDIVTAADNTFAINSSGEVTENGVAMTDTSGVIELAYVNGTLYQEATGNLWWSFNETTNAWSLATDPLTASSTTSSTGASDPPPTVSANDTVVNGTTDDIVTAAHNVFAIDAGGQITENGVAMSDTAYVTELAYVNGTLYQENIANLWWSFNESTNAWTATSDPLTTSAGSTSGSGASDPPPTDPPSANETVVVGTNGDIVTAAHNTFAIDAGGQITENGTALSDTASVMELAYINGTLYQENIADMWWSFNESTNTWTATSDPLTTTDSGSSTPTPSANDTVVTGMTGDIVTAAHNTFAINSTGEVTENGVAMTNTSGVTELAYVNGTLYQETTGNMWQSFNETTDAWSLASDPLPGNSGTSSGSDPTPSGTTTISTFTDNAGHEVFAVETVGSTPATIGNFNDSDVLDLVPVMKAATSAGGHPALSYVSDGNGGTLVELSTTGSAANAHPLVDLQHILPTDAQAHVWV